MADPRILQCQPAQAYQPVRRQHGARCGLRRRHSLYLGDPRGKDRPRPGRDLSRGPEGAKRTGMFIGGKRDSGPRHDEAGQGGDGAAVRGVRVRRSRRLLHHRRGHGRLRREGTQGKTTASSRASAWPCSAPLAWSASPPGSSAAVEGAKAVLVGHDGVQRVAQARRGGECAFRRRTRLRRRLDRGAEDRACRGCRRDLLGRSRRAKAAQHRATQQATHLLVATDVNAVPPAGVEGVGVNDDGVPIPGTRRGRHRQRSRSATSSTAPRPGCSSR